MVSTRELEQEDEWKLCWWWVTLTGSDVTEVTDRLLIDAAETERSKWLQLTGGADEDDDEAAATAAAAATGSVTTEKWTGGGWKRMLLADAIDGDLGGCVSAYWAKICSRFGYICSCSAPPYTVYGAELVLNCCCWWLDISDLNSSACSCFSCCSCCCCCG